MKDVRERLVIVPEVALALPKSDTDEKIILDKVADLVKNEEIKIILSKDDAEFQKNYNNMMDKLEQIGVKKIEEYMTKEAKKYME